MSGALLYTVNVGGVEVCYGNRAAMTREFLARAEHGPCSLEFIRRCTRHPLAQSLNRSAPPPFDIPYVTTAQERAA